MLKISYFYNIIIPNICLAVKEIHYAKEREYRLLYKPA